MLVSDVALLLVLCQFSGHSGTIRTLDWVGERLVSAGAGDCALRVWDVHRGDAQMVLSRDRHEGAVFELRAVGRQGDQGVASASADGTVRLWDLRTGLKSPVAAAHTPKDVLCPFSRGYWCARGVSLFHFWINILIHFAALLSPCRPCI